MTKRLIRLLLIVVLVLGTVLTACDSSKAGTYYDERSPKNFIELRSDGTYLNSFIGLNTTGKWEDRGDEIELTDAFGFVIRASMKGDTIISPLGQRLTRR